MVACHLTPFAIAFLCLQIQLMLSFGIPSINNVSSSSTRPCYLYLMIVDSVGTLDTLVTLVIIVSCSFIVFSVKWRLHHLFVYGHL